MLVDVHCHFDFPQFDGRREQLMGELRGQGIGGLVIPGVRCADWPKVQQVAMAHSGVFYCLGIHPWYIDEHGPEDLQRLRGHLANASELCVGVGECGLDRLRGSLSEQLSCSKIAVDSMVLRYKRSFFGRNWVITETDDIGVGFFCGLKYTSRPGFSRR